MSSSDSTTRSSRPGKRGRAATAVCGAGLAAGVLALVVVAPAQAQVAVDGLPFLQLQKQVDQLARDLQTERTARSQDVAALQAALASERQAREAGDATLTTALSAEAAARTSADSGLGKRIDDEERARKQADEALRSLLGDETDARQAADDSMLGRIDALERRSFTTRVKQGFLAVDAADAIVFTHYCNSDERAVGGGWLADLDEDVSGRYMNGSAPTEDGTGWRVELENDLLSDWDGSVYVVCAKLS